MLRKKFEPRFVTFSVFGTQKLISAQEIMTHFLLQMLSEHK
jgi:hypothetical protein